MKTNRQIKAKYFFLNKKYRVPTPSKIFHICHYGLKSIQILLRTQESRIINGGTTKKYFKLEKGDPISADVFIHNLEIALLYFIENKNIKKINVFSNIFLYSPYADDITLFVSDEDSVIEVIDAFDEFSLLSGLKPNKARYEALVS